MIHMRSAHRCVMAIFTITTPGQSSQNKIIKRKTRYHKAWREWPNRKNIEVEKLELEKRYQGIIEKIKEKAPPQKKHQRKQKAKMQKHKQKMSMLQQKQKVKTLKRKQKKSKERGQEPWWMTAWRRQEKQVEDILDFTSERRGRSHRVSHRTCRTRHERRHGRKNENGAWHRECEM